MFPLIEDFLFFSFLSSVEALETFEILDLMRYLLQGPLFRAFLGMLLYFLKEVILVLVTALGCYITTVQLQ